MKFFTKNEMIGISIIFAVVFAVTFRGLFVSERRARDAQRKGDLGAISDALYKHLDDFGYFPPSEDGKIKACKGQNFDAVLSALKDKDEFDRNFYFSGLTGCVWGRDSLKDVTDEEYEPYLRTIPSDPKSISGLSYIYLSNTGRFQLYAYLEGENDEGGYDERIVSRNLKCGGKICNFGKSSGDTPLNRSIEEYETELFEKSKSGS